MDLFGILSGLSDVNEHLGRHDEAVSYMDRALQRARKDQSEDEEAWAHAKLALLTKDDKTKAAAHVKELAFLSSDDEAEASEDWRLAKQSLRLGRYNEALHVFSRL